MLTGIIARTVTDVEFPVADTYASVTPPPARLGVHGLPNFGEPNAHILVTAAAPVPYQGYALSEETIDTVRGRVFAVRPNRDRTSWYLTRLGETAMYLNGPLVNPDPINGHHYREFLPQEPMNTRAPYVLRYNDEMHRQDRADSDYPWSIVRGGNMLTPSSGQGVQRFSEPQMYVEIQWPVPPAGATDEEIDSILSAPEVAVDRDAPPTDSLPPLNPAPEERTGGLGVVEESGTVLLDPPLEPGQAYLVWDEGRNYYDSLTTAGYLLEDGITFALHGYYNLRDGQAEWVADQYQGEVNSTRTSVHWAKLATQAHTENPEASAEKVAALLAQREAEFNAFESLNTRLNELADTQDWCGEYETTMGRIGMRARRGSARLIFDPGVASANAPICRAWNVDVDVSFSGEIDYIRGGLESEIESAASFSGSVSSVRFDASANVTITGIIADDEDDARAQVSADAVENAMDNEDIAYSDIVDWNVNDVNEDDDFDWEEYDDNN